MKPRTDLAIESTDGELIVLDKDGGQVHQLNQSAALIWRGLDEGLAAEDIALELSSVFEVDLERASGDVKTVIDQFLELGLLEE